MEEYCQAHSLPYYSMNPSQEAQEAVEAYQDQLWPTTGEITYYLPEPQAFYPEEQIPGRRSHWDLSFSKFSCPFPVSVVH